MDLILRSFPSTLFIHQFYNLRHYALNRDGFILVNRALQTPLRHSGTLKHIHSYKLTSLKNLR